MSTRTVIRNIAIHKLDPKVNHYKVDKNGNFVNNKKLVSEKTEEEIKPVAITSEDKVDELVVMEDESITLQEDNNIGIINDVLDKEEVETMIPVSTKKRVRRKKSEQ
jgi:hypothetical protein